jgi:glycerate dehydrogenase
MKIVILDGYTLNPGDLSWEPLKELGEVTVYERTAPKDACKRAEGAEVVFTNKVVLDEAVLEKLPSLKYIGVLATGYNVVDVAAAARKGIVVTNIPAYSTSSVAQMAFAHILNIVQRVGYYAQEVSNGKWSRQADFSFWDAPLHELDGKKIGIIGFGNTGRATARIAVGFGLDVYAYTSKSAMELPADVHKCPSMDELFRKCDIVSLHCPLTETTRELVDARKLDLMKPSAILINTGRGGLVNEQDLADALNSGKIAAAGLDVLSSEPPRADNPLLKARNCFITPHQAWATKEARVRLMQLAVNNLKAFLEGKPVNVVNN